MNVGNYSANVLGRPAWLKEFAGRDFILPQPARLIAAEFEDVLAIRVQVNAPGNVAAGAVAIPVDALTAPVPAGTTLRFGAGKFAQTTADALAGATSLTVEATAAIINDNSIAYVSRGGAKQIPGGTLVGRTYAERDAGTPYGAATDTDDEIYFIPFDVTDANRNPDCELLRHGSTIAENHLPARTREILAANANLLAKVRGFYVLINAAD